ncbi:MAG: hypothetical protein H9533_11705 [Rhodobacteraceae bacterium]|nr:hypothetical protein [Paracoccaceae bacterium]
MNPSQDLCNKAMIAENVSRLDSATLDINLLNIVAAAFTQMDHRDLQVKIDINSPGIFSITDRSVVPLLISAMLSVFSAVNFDPKAIAQELNVEVINSRGGEALSVCKDVERLTESMLRLMTSAEDEFKKTCELLKAAHNNTGAKSSVSVGVERDRR